MSVNIDTLNAAIFEAKRFIKKAEAAKKSDPFRSKETAATRRSSLDLSRALSEMRRP